MVKPADIYDHLTLNFKLIDIFNQEPSILDANEEDQIAAAIRASLAPSESKEEDEDEVSESEIEPFSGEDSNFSLPTPRKR